MTLFWTFLTVLAGAAGVRYLARLHAARASRGRVVDDDAVRRILEEGTLTTDEDDEPLDLEEAARAEEEFWAESWDEPDEYPR